MTTVCRYRTPDVPSVVLLYRWRVFENRVLRAGDKNELGIISDPNLLCLECLKRRLTIDLGTEGTLTPYLAFRFPRIPRAKEQTMIMHLRPACLALALAVTAGPACAQTWVYEPDVGARVVYQPRVYQERYVAPVYNSYAYQPVVTAPTVAIGRHPAHGGQPYHHSATTRSGADRERAHCQRDLRAGSAAVCGRRLRSRPSDCGLCIRADTCDRGLCVRPRTRGDIGVRLGAAAPPGSEAARRG